MTLSVPDEGYSSNMSGALNLISTFLFVNYTTHFLFKVNVDDDLYTINIMCTWFMIITSIVLLFNRIGTFCKITMLVL
jgi:hypothetical protein